MALLVISRFGAPLMLPMFRAKQLVVVYRDNIKRPNGSRFTSRVMDPLYHSGRRI